MFAATNSGASSKRWFFGAFMLATGVRLYLLWQYYCISSDGVVYVRTAENFFAGEVSAALASVYPPGYPLLIAAIYPLVGDWELAGQILSIVFGVSLLFPLYWLLRDVFDERVALLACYLAGISPFMALYSVHVRTESAYLFFSTLALYVIATALERQDKTRFFLGGSVAGYAYLVRPEAVGLLAFVPGILLFLWILRKLRDVSWIAQSTVALALGFSLFALPYIAYLSIDTGHFGAISRKAGQTLGINLRESGLLDAEDVAEGDDVRSLVFTDLIRRHPLRYVKNVGSDLIPAVGVFFEAIHYSYVPFLLLGLILALREKSWSKSRCLSLGFVLFYVFAFAFVYVKRRYALQAVPIALGWVAVGAWWIWDRLQTQLLPKNALLVKVSVLSIFLLTTVPKTLKPVSQEKAYLRETGWYLKDRNKGGELKIATRDLRIPFYAKAEMVSLVKIDQSQLAKIVREQEVDYVALGEKILQRSYPDVAARPRQHGLALEKTFVGTRKDRILLYRVI
jgi:4-amino-4-deoxy-L-arabinose transferase-like glycosyltransferase